MLDSIIDHKSLYINDFDHDKKLNVQSYEWIEIKFQHFRLIEPKLKRRFLSVFLIDERRLEIKLKKSLFGDLNKSIRVSTSHTFGVEGA